MFQKISRIIGIDFDLIGTFQEYSAYYFPFYKIDDDNNNEFLKQNQTGLDRDDDRNSHLAVHHNDQQLYGRLIFQVL